MVNFGGHLSAIRAEEQKVVPEDPPQTTAVGEGTTPKNDDGGTIITTTTRVDGSSSSSSDTLYLVPYNTIKQCIAEHEGRRDFEVQWKQALHYAETDTQRAIQSLWQVIFDHIPVVERGCLVGRAMELYVQSVSMDHARQTLTQLTRIHARTITNSEALRKLVKKYDKRYPVVRVVPVVSSEDPPPQSPQQLLSTKLLRKFSLVIVVVDTGIPLTLYFSLSLFFFVLLQLQPCCMQVQSLLDKPCYKTVLPRFVPF
jgi:hypothetical protein